MVQPAMAVAISWLWLSRKAGYKLACRRSYGCNFHDYGYGYGYGYGWLYLMAIVMVLLTMVLTGDYGVAMAMSFAVAMAVVKHGSSLPWL
jgi:hypothetical protein